MKPRVFISHSTKDETAHERLSQLREALSEAEFDALVDVEHLRPGQKWRDELYTWLGVCDFAVVIITPRSLEPDNPWVAREANILMWRRVLDTNFHVAWILADGTRPEDLNQGLFKDLLIQEMQLVVAETGSDQWLTDVRDELVRRKEQTWPINPVDTLSLPIARELQAFDDPTLHGLADVLDVDLGPWCQSDNPARNLAAALLHVGIEGADEAIDHLAVHGASQSTLETILELIAPSWVDLCAAKSLASAAHKVYEKPVLLLNAKSDFAATMFVRRASGRPPRVEWPRIVLPTLFGELGEEDVADRLNEALKSTLRINADPLARDDGQRLAAIIDRHKKKGRPIFVVSRYSDGVSRHLRALQDRFPTLTFLALTGEEMLDDEPVPDGFERILPELRDGEEDNAWPEYTYCKAMIMGGA